MKPTKVPLVEAVSRALCMAAVTVPEEIYEQVEDGRVFCLHCKDETECTLWKTFEREAKAAVQAVRKSDRGK